MRQPTTPKTESFSLDREPRYRQLQAAASYWNVSTKTMRRRIEDGSVKACRVGSKIILIDLNDLDDLLNPISTADADMA